MQGHRVEERRSSVITYVRVDQRWPLRSLGENYYTSHLLIDPRSGRFPHREVGRISGAHRRIAGLLPGLDLLLEGPELHQPKAHQHDCRYCGCKVYDVLKVHGVTLA